MILKNITEIYSLCPCFFDSARVTEAFKDAWRISGIGCEKTSRKIDISKLENKI